MKNKGIYIFLAVAIVLVLGVIAAVLIKNRVINNPGEINSESGSDTKVVVLDLPGGDNPSETVLPDTSEIIPDTSEVPTSDIPDNSENPADTSEKDIREYFANSIFIGDSVVAGYRDYLALHKDSPVSGATFLAASSYTAAHALNEEDDLHPLFRGKKQPVWNNISDTGAKRVFIMFGTNDLVVKDAIRASEDILALVDKIHEQTPGVEVHLISMTPVYEDVSKGALNNPTIDVFNYYLLQGAMEHGTGYLDVNTLLKDENGNIREEYCSDNYVHETDEAYEKVWDGALSEFATQHLNPEDSE